MAIPSSISSSAKLPEDHLKAGAAEVDITPQPGIPLTGFIARPGPSIGVHDRLYARALALQAGGQWALIMACDLLALDASFVAAARAAICEATGIPENAILIACTHTHSGPATIFLRDCGAVEPTYLDRLRQMLAQVAQQAVSDLRSARMGAGRGQFSGGVLNRRLPGEPADPALDVISFRDEGGKYLAILVNFACHAVCLDASNRMISADYPGVLARMLQEQTGAVVLFTNSACGDINPERMGSFTFAEELGGALATETWDILHTLAYQEVTRLEVVNEIIHLPLQPAPDRVELERMVADDRRACLEAEAVGKTIEAKVYRAMTGWAEDTLARVLRGDSPTQLLAEIQVICLDDISLVGIPGELFSGLGREIKSSHPIRQVVVLGYANDDIGYVPTRQAYAQGGYEIQEAFKYYGYPAPLAPDAGDLVKRSVDRLLERCSVNQSV